MSDLSIYTTVPGKIPTLLKKIRDVGVPPKATISWLKSVGLTSSNDASLLKVLSKVGFTDQSGTPQPAWREYRGANSRSVLGRAIIVGYPELYGTYSDAHNRTNEELAHIFSMRTNAGKQAIDKMIASFKYLANEADFEVGASQAEPSAQSNDTAETARAVGGTETIRHRTETASGVTINVNVALTLPETTDSKVYEAFFSSMRKHLIESNLP